MNAPHTPVEIQVIQPAVAYSATEAALADLEQRFRGIAFDVTTPEGMAEAKDAKKTLTKLRTALEAKRKEIKDPVVELGRQIDGEAKRITDRIVVLEKPIAEQIEAEEARAKKAEEARKAGLESRLQSIKDMPTLAAGKSSAEITVLLDTLRNLPIDESWQEYQEPAHLAKANAVLALTDMQGRVVAQEAEAQRLAAERAELDRLRAADEARRKAEDEERARKATEQEAANKAEADRLAKARAEFERQQAEARAKQAAEEAAARDRIAEQERIAAEARAKAEAESRAAEETARKAREAEQARLAEIERQRIERASARELLDRFVTKFGHLEEFAGVVESIKKLPADNVIPLRAA